MLSNFVYFDCAPTGEELDEVGCEKITIVIHHLYLVFEYNF